MPVLAAEGVYNDNHASWVADDILYKAEILLDYVLRKSREKIRLMEDKAYNALCKKDYYCYDTVQYKELIPDGDGMVSIRGLFRSLAKKHGLEDENGNNGHLMIVSALTRRSIMWRKGRDKYNVRYPKAPTWDVFVGGEKSFFQLFESSIRRRRTSNHREIDDIMNMDVLGDVLKSEQPPTREPSRKTSKKEDKPVSVGTSLSEPLAKIQAEKDATARKAALEALLAETQAEIAANIVAGTPAEIPPAPQTLSKAQKKAQRKAMVASQQNPALMGTGNTIPPNAPTVAPPPPATIEPLTTPLEAPASIPGLPR